MKKLLIAILAVTGFVSCKKMLDVKPKDELDISQMYRNVYDADAAVVGIYGKFAGLAERYVLLNELRGDQLEYTDNADAWLRQLSTHTVTADNPYASPRPFYELIINCNDVLKNFNIMKQANKLKESEYEQRYADVLCLRAFLYLQLGIHYGSVPYVTDALETVDALKDEKNFPRLPFTVLLDSLINETERLTFKNEYPTGATLNITVDGYPTTKWFINKKCLLGDLHLWKGNYTQAATYYRQVMEFATTGTPGGAYYSMYKVGWDNVDTDHYINYGRPGDATTLNTTAYWRMMFEKAMNTQAFIREWVWAIPFDSKFKPVNPFVKLFSPIGGEYLVKPSKAAVNYWESQQQRAISATGINMPGLPYDARGLLTWKEIGGQPVVMKYLYNYINNSTNLPYNVFQKSGKWFLYRQTHLHMRFAEAANRTGRHRLAWGLFNGGFEAAFRAPGSNVTDYQNTLYDSYPYNFDARNSGSSGIPYYRGDWYRNVGIRRRANVQDIVVPAADSLLQIENDLIMETALENAYEGTRWPDLLRIALRRNEPAFLADKIFDKLTRDGIAGAAEARGRLMNPANWYLPFKL